MIHSIRGKLVVSVVVMAVLLGLLIYVSSVRLGELETTLDDLQDLQEFKSHVLIPQKDMNQFMAAVDETVLFLELGDAQEAQRAFDDSVDAEQDISVEFAFLEDNSEGELLEASQQAHLDWESATEFLKIYAETVARERGIELVRPSTDPTKTVDEHTAQAIDAAQADYAGLTSAQLSEIAENPDVSPAEAADEGIDGLEVATDEVLTAENEAGDQTLSATSQTIIFGSLGALLAIVLIGFVVTVSVSRPLVALKDGAEKIADGDLGYAFQNVPNDEVGAVIHSVERMSGALKGRIANLEELAGVVMLTGEEIETAATAIEPKGSEVETILAKAATLKELVGQMLKSTKG